MLEQSAVAVVDRAVGLVSNPVVAQESVAGRPAVVAVVVCWLVGLLHGLQQKQIKRGRQTI